MSTKYVDNSDEVLKALEKAINNGLNRIGLSAVSHATDLTPEDTGYLRNSITYAIGGEETHIKKYSANKSKTSGEDVREGTYSGKAPKESDPYVVIGSNVEYAPIIELGGSGRKAFHMLQRAASEHSDEYKRIMADEMKNA